jgi:hypothetical protein
MCRAGVSTAATGAIASVGAVPVGSCDPAAGRMDVPNPPMISAAAAAGSFKNPSADVALVSSDCTSRRRSSSP